MRNVMKSTAFLLLVSLTFVGCKSEGCTDPTATNYDSDAKKDDGSCSYPAAGADISIESDNIFVYTVDGVLTEFSGFPQQGVMGSDGEIGTVTTTKSWSTGIYDMDLEYSLIDISKGELSYPTGSLTDADFLSYFAPGTYTYATNGEKDGIVVGIDTPSGEYYRSNVGAQSGATFEIVESRAEELLGVSYVKVYCTYSCKVYNVDDPTDVKTITGGKLVSHYEDI